MMHQRTALLRKYLSFFELSMQSPSQSANALRNALSSHSRNSLPHNAAGGLVYRRPACSTASKRCGVPSALSLLGSPIDARKAMLSVLIRQKINAAAAERVLRGDLTILQRRAVRTVTNHGAAVWSRTRQIRELTRLHSLHIPQPSPPLSFLPMLTMLTSDAVSVKYKSGHGNFCRLSHESDTEDIAFLRNTLPTWKKILGVTKREHVRILCLLKRRRRILDTVLPACDVSLHTIYGLGPRDAQLWDALLHVDNYKCDDGGTSDANVPKLTCHRSNLSNFE
eukprot:IDg10662t1